ncbi:hig-anchoring scaffold protein isoform X2 [Lasioglossum baleicum]|uniref:hig-anchoring scaffold protein isoform X2 n=1 Tax=Lasioglossum baleicum TaxID=434251 RepID=UPI003FCE760F
MRPSALLLLFLCTLFIASSESKLRQQAAVVDDDDDDDDDWDDDEDDDDDDQTYQTKPEVDDDGRIYKNPRNSPSAMCPRDEKQASQLGQKCLRKCSSDEDCKSKKKKCRCDGVCGMSCIKPERECPVLTEIQHGTMTVSSRFFGDRAHYTCDPDYYTVGLTERICRADGQWTGTTPSCKKDPTSFCSQPPKVKNARHNALAEQSTFDLDSDIQYFCDHGYMTNGVRKAKCLLMEGNASWFGPDITCEPQQCGPPADIANGWHAGECYTYDCRVSYHCADGNELVGKAEKLCLADGTWTPKESPQCVQVTTVECPIPESPAKGQALYTSYAYNAIVHYTCDYGYTVVGASTRRCGADRKWTGKMPTCQEINCGSPGVLYNGWIENIEDGTGLGASIIYRCNDHMKLEGNGSSVCLADGKWRYPLPQCLAPCVVPQIENGNITVASHEKDDHINNVTVVEHGERLLVSCVKNYEFAANFTPVVCNNGTWSIVPSCSPARCKVMPKPPKNGMVLAPKTDHGMRAAFKCKDGFQLVGGGPNNDSKSIQCQYGNWTGDIPHCIQVFCPFPGSIENGKVFLVGNMGVYDYRPYVKKVVNNKQIMYDCDKGYVLDEGPTGATCIGGKWSPKDLPKCIPGQHPRLRWSRRRRSISDEDLTMRYRKFIEFFRKIGKKLLRLELNKGKDHGKHKSEKPTNSTQHRDNSTDSSSKKHVSHANRTKLREEKMIDFLEIAYRKLQRIDARQSNNSANGSMHDLLNAMSKNFFHVDLSEARRNNSKGRSDFEVRNQREFIKLKRKFEKIMRFYNKSTRWNEKGRKESRKKGQAHGDKSKKSKDKKKHRKNYYKGFYEFVNSYVTEKLSMLEARNATEELIKKMNIDKFTVRNGSTFTVGEMYAFFKHIIEAKLNSSEETSETTTLATSSSTSTSTMSSTSTTTTTSTTTLATPREIESHENRSSTVPVNESSTLDNEIPSKEGAPKHRSKRIRNASEDVGPTRQKRKLLGLNVLSMRKDGSRRVRRGLKRSRKAYDDEKTRQFTFKELEAQQQSRSKRFLPLSELDNQIFLKNLYLNAYEDEYRANVKRSIDQGNHTNEQQQQQQQQPQQQPAVYRRRKGNLGAYEIK